MSSLERAGERATGGLRVGVLCGGRSTEHAVSIATGQSVIAALELGGFEAVPIYIDPSGRWLTGGSLRQLVQGTSPASRVLVPARATCGELLTAASDGWPVVPEGALPTPSPVDVVFPALHGRGGEDGSVQGLLELASLPYVGAGVLGSALSLDKVAMKRALVAAGLRVADFVAFTRREWDAGREAIVATVEERLGYPCFTKFANSGSSVGTSRVRDRDELVRGVELAAQFDRRLLVERAIDAREIEVGVLGNDGRIASVCGEVLPHSDFYSYHSKYTEGGAELRVPADLPEATARSMRDQAVCICEELDVAGMARVDFFLEYGTGEIIVNELNTIPGLTGTSMFPRVWQASGISYPELMRRLVELALQRHEERGWDRTCAGAPVS